jgi:hypothetical protein
MRLLSKSSARTAKSGVRTAVLSGGVAALTALAVAGAPALAQNSAPSDTPTPPVIVSGVGHSTVFLSTATFTTLGKLHLGAGSWTVFAKAEVTGQTVLLHCRLTAGTDSDLIDPSIDGSTVYSQEVTLNVTHVFASAGNAVFACNSSGVSVAANQIKMTAIKAGKLTRVNL